MLLVYTLYMHSRAGIASSDLLCGLGLVSRWILCPCPVVRHRCQKGHPALDLSGELHIHRVLFIAGSNYDTVTAVGGFIRDGALSGVLPRTTYRSVPVRSDANGESVLF